MTDSPSGDVVTLNGGTDYIGIFSNHASLAGIDPQDTVSYQLFNATTHDINVEPYVQDTQHVIHFVGGKPLLKAGAHTTVSFAVPSLQNINELGFQIDNVSRYSGTISLESISVVP